MPSTACPAFIVHVPVPPSLIHVWDAVPYNVFTVKLPNGSLVTLTIDVQVFAA